MQSIEIGKLLRAGTTGFVVGCSVSQFSEPMFGAIVRAPVYAGYEVFGMIQDIHIDDDGLVRQLVTSSSAISEEVLRDNRERRIVPVEMSVLSIGYRKDGQLFHLLPPQPPLSLDRIYLCDEAEVAQFTGHGRFGYLRHILRNQSAPVGELLAAHLKLAGDCHGDHSSVWMASAVKELITQLRDDYQTLMAVLHATSEIMPDMES